MNIRIPKYTALLATFAATTALAPALHAQWTASTDFNYSTGKYGQKEKTAFYVSSISAEYAIERWSGRIIIPYYVVSGPGNVVPRLGVVNGRRRLILTQTTQTDRGLGDVVLAASYDAINEKDNNWFVSVTGEIKLATADQNKGLGTGKRDYSPRIDISYSVGDFTPYASLGYRFLGKPTGSDLKDYPYGSLGVTYSVDDSTSVSGSFDHYGASSKTTHVDNELSVSLSHRLDQAWRVGVNALVGLTSSAPDYGGGASASFTF